MHPHNGPRAKLCRTLFTSAREIDPKCNLLFCRANQALLSIILLFLSNRIPHFVLCRLSMCNICEWIRCKDLVLVTVSLWWQVSEKIHNKRNLRLNPHIMFLENANVSFIHPFMIIFSYSNMKCFSLMFMCKILHFALEYDLMKWYTLEI